MIRVLGPLQIDDADGAPVRVSDLLVRLIAVLASEPNEAVASADVIDAMWPAGAPRTAAAAMRNNCAELRKQLELAGLQATLETVRRSDDTAYLLSIAPSELDHLQFRQLVTLGERLIAEERHTEAVEALEAAVSLWRGPAFADIDGVSTHPLVHRLNLSRISASELLAERYLAADRPDAAVWAMSEIAAADPLLERAAEFLMRGLYRTGRATEALDVFQRTRRALAQDLGLEPNNALRALEHAILAHDQQLGAGAAPMQQAGRGPFIGREQLHDSIREAVQTAGDNHVVLGAAGLGKSRLAAEIHQALASEGVPTVLARPTINMAVAFDVVDQLLAAIDTGAFSGVEVARAAREELNSPAGEIGPDRLHSDQLARFVDALVAIQPTAAGHALFTIDDAHRIDSLSLAIVRAWMGRSSAVRFLLTGRPAVTNESWLAFLADPSATHDLRFVSLNPLTQQEVVDWIRASGSGDRVPADTAGRLIHSQTSGVAFYVDACMRELLASDDPSASLLSFTAPTLPNDLAGPLAARVHRLSSTEREFLIAAAVVGREFSVDEARALALAHFGEAQWSPSSASRSDMIYATNVEADDFAFEHDLTRAALLAYLDSSELSALHYQRYLQLRDADADPRLLSTHVMAAVEQIGRAEASDVVTRAADALYEASLFTEAVARYGDAISLLPQTEAATSEPSLRLRIGQSRARQHAGSREVALPELRSILQDALADGQVDVAGEAGLALADFGEVLVLDDPIRWLLVDVVDKLPDASPLTALLLAEVAIKHTIVDGATELVRHAVDRLERLAANGDPQAAPQADRVWLHVMAGSPVADERLERARSLQQQLPLGPRTDRSWLDALLFEGSALLELGDIGAARVVLADYGGAAQTSGRPGAIWLAKVAEADLAQLAGRADEASRHAAAALQYANENDVPDALASYSGFSMMTALLDGTLGEMNGLLNAMVDLPEPNLPIVAGRALLAAGNDRRELAEQEIDAAIDWCDEHQPYTLTAWSIAMVAEAVGMLRDNARAERLLPLLAPYAGTMPRMALVGSTTGPADRQLGQLHAVLGNTDQAAKHFATALALARQAESPGWETHVLLGWRELDATVPTDRLGELVIDLRESGNDRLAERVAQSQESSP